MDETLLPRIRQACETLHPGSAVTETAPLHGGVSATSLLITLQTPDRQAQKLVLRRPGHWLTDADPLGIDKEFAYLNSLHTVGLPCPEPLYLEPPNLETPYRFYLLSYISGAPDLSPADPQSYIDQYARLLAQIHQTKPDQIDVSTLPKTPQSPNPTTRPLDLLLQEDKIRAVLTNFSPGQSTNTPALCHGDFWPGNILWQNGTLTGILDWEEVYFGEPLYDLAICRLDLTWVLGHELAALFTNQYLALNPLDTRHLPYFDLQVALRPAGYLEKWAPAYPKLGRSDLTVDNLAQVHREFVNNALARLPN